MRLPAAPAGGRPGSRSVAKNSVKNTNTAVSSSRDPTTAALALSSSPLSAAASSSAARPSTTVPCQCSSLNRILRAPAARVLTASVLSRRGIPTFALAAAGKRSVEASSSPKPSGSRTWPPTQPRLLRLAPARPAANALALSKLLTVMVKRKKVAYLRSSARS